jgi:ATP-binding cassette subfamily F protein uup
MEGNGHVRIYNGNYSSYRIEQEEAKQVKKAEPVVTTQSAKKSKLSFKETKELEGLETEIAGIEEKVKQCNEQLNVAGIETNKLNGLLGEIARLTKELDNKTMRWLELCELKES